MKDAFCTLEHKQAPDGTRYNDGHWGSDEGGQSVKNSSIKANENKQMKAVVQHTLSAKLGNEKKEEQEPQDWKYLFRVTFVRKFI